MPGFFWLGLLIFLPGAAAWLAFGRRLGQALSAAEKGFFLLLGGVLFLSPPALILAELQLFTLPRLVAVQGILTLPVVGFWLQSEVRAGTLLKSIRSLGRPATVLALAGVVAGLWVWVIGPPSEYLIGGRDHGVYVNTGVHIARSGGILIDDEALRLAPAASRPLLTNPAVDTFQAGFPGPWSEGQRISGFTIRDLDRGIITPHAFHLYPAWFAVFYAAGGLDFLLWPTVGFALLGLWGVALTAGRLYGRPVAAAALALLATNLVQAWFARYPTAEILLQPLFWGGLLAAILWLRTGSRYAAVLAGLAFGLTHLAKLDTVFIPIGLLVFFSVRRLSGRRQPGAAFFWIPYGLLLAHAAVHALAISTIYSIDHAVRTLLPGFLANPLAAAAAGHTYPVDILTQLWRENGSTLLLLAVLGGLAVVGLWLASRRLAPADPGPWKFPWGQRAAALLLAAALIGLFLLDGTPFELVGSVVVGQMGWYLTPLALGLALLGFSLRLAETSDGVELFALWMVLINIAPFFALGMGTAADHFWTIRRFVPVFVPAVLLFAPVGLSRWRLAWPAGRLVDRPVLMAGVLLLAVLFFRQTYPFTGRAEYDGLTGQLTELAGRFDPGDILLLEVSRDAIELGTPLWLIFDRPAFLIDPFRKGDPALSQAVQTWQADGRRVYWLSQVGVQDLALPGIGSQYAGTVLISGRRAEQTINRLPDGYERFATTLDIFELILDGAETSVLRTLFLAAGDDTTVRDGLYPPEAGGQGQLLRWTAGAVRLTPPVDGRPERLLLLASNPRPPEVPAPEVTVQVNGIELGRFVPEREGRVVSFDLGGIPPADSYDIELLTTTWNPRTAGYNLDDRSLGFDLTWVKIISQTP